MAVLGHIREAPERVTATFLNPRRSQCGALALVALGVGALWGLSAVGGFGGSSGRSMWWGALLLPYPAGWILGVVGAVRVLREPSVPSVPSTPP